MSEELKKCPQCECPYAYSSADHLYTCPDCNHEWNPEELAKADEVVVKDASGNILQNGDTVMLIKDLPVKGAKGGLKSGTKVKNIKLAEGDHNIDCRIEGFGVVALKSEFVRKV